MMTQEHEQDNNGGLSPREFLRARRPERFSDSVVGVGSVLDRQILEYQLESLTSRSQEIDFEDFARRMVEHEICPNLIPHTGPTGGGDSKVDTETYPVSDGLSFAWYTGIGREAAGERWAFAFSAKKKWLEKARTDVAKIAATQRDYRKAFFVSSRFVSDKTRAQIEDELRTAYHIDVRILDRSWILDRVFRSGLENLAIDALKLSPSLRKMVQTGPLDLQRQRDLEELEARIKEGSRQGRLGIQFVADCIEAAELSRGLDRPRVETDGRFLRAQRAAESHGNTHQRLVAAYQRAWTTYWWYEDFGSFPDLYSDVEKQASGSENAYDFELLFNLWVLLQALVRTGTVTEVAAQLGSRTKNLVAQLERLSAVAARPSAALQARTLRLQMSLHMGILSAIPLEIDKALKELGEVVRQCSGLAGFPFEPLVEVLTEVGRFLGDRPEYNELFEALLKSSSTRGGEVTAARLLCKRGAEQLRQDRPYDAIRSLGRALGLLYKHESRHDLVRALYLCGSAYERVGLLWAARGALVTAASVATSEFWTYADVTTMQAGCYNRIKWLELQLGRLPHALAWHEIDICVKNVLADQGYAAAYLAQGEIEFGMILGILILKTDPWQLKHLSRLPDVLDKMGLDSSAIALRFALGYENALPDKLVPNIRDERQAFFAKWRDQPAAEDIPSAPALYECRTVTLESRVLGCRVTLESENRPACCLLAESVLAALESLLATGLTDRLMAREPVLKITIRRSEFVGKPFSFELTEPEGIPHVIIRCGDFDPHSIALTTQGEIKAELSKLLTLVFARVFLHGEIEDVITKLFRDEKALERALHFSGSFITLGNVLGHSPKTSISAWALPSEKEYPLRRSEAWDFADRRAAEGENTGGLKPELKPGHGEVPKEILTSERIKHTDIKTVSFIRETLWNRAKWSGTGFLWDEGDSAPPVLALAFKEADAARLIFSHWRKEIGSQDRDEMLRVSIIRHMDKNSPHSYRVIIGINPSVVFSESETKQGIMISRINTMVPSSDYNLTQFLQSFKQIGGYFLAPAVIEEEMSPLLPLLETCIAKRDLFVREAWEIGRHDPDCMGIKPDDDPSIPHEQANAPVLELLTWLRARESSTAGE